MVNLDRARLFIHNNGDAVDKARLEFILDNITPSSEIFTQLFSSQRQDGSWSPFWKPDYSSLDATCFRLAQANQFDMGEDENAFANALAFIVTNQLPNGSWEEDPSVATNAPFWVKPGDLKATLYLTANCSYWTSISHKYRGVAKKGARYILGSLDENGYLPSFLQTHWLSGGLWARLGMKRPTERILGYLKTRISELSANSIAWMLSALLSASVAVNHTLIQSAIPKLTSFQQNDGRWQSDDGEDFDVHTTLEALHGLKLSSRLD
jgi:hypothetical protein